MLLIGKLRHVPDLAKVRVIFETQKRIRRELSRQTRGGRKVQLAKFAEAGIHDRVDDEFVVRVTDTDDRPHLQREPRLREWRRRVAEFQIDAIEEVTLVGVGRDEQGPQLEGIGQEFLILDGEGQIEADLPPVGEAIGEFRRAVEAVVGDKAAGKRRVLEPKRDIIEVLLDRELADGRDAGIVDLDFVNRPCRLRQRESTRLRRPTR